MNKDTEITKVIFRKFREDNTIIAYFPELAYDVSGYMAVCYVHFGQHSGADYEVIQGRSVPATKDEYNDLKIELESLGYKLQVIKRQTYKHFLTRKNTKWE